MHTNLHKSKLQFSSNHKYIIFSICEAPLRPIYKHFQNYQHNLDIPLEQKLLEYGMFMAGSPAARSLPGT